MSDPPRRSALDVTELIRRHVLAARATCGCRGVRVRIEGPGEGECLVWSFGGIGPAEEPRWSFPLDAAGRHLGALELFGGGVEPGGDGRVDDCAALVRALAKDLGSWLGRHDRLAPEGEARHPALVRAVRFILCNYRTSLNLALVARQAHVSASHLSHLFQCELDTTFVAFVNRLRTDYARRLLLTRTDLPVTRVAMRAGFSDLRHFQRVFKARVGCTATELRSRAAVARPGPRGREKQESPPDP